MVEKESCHTVLAQFRSVSIKEVRYQHAEPACSHTAGQMRPCWDPHECAAATFQTEGRRAIIGAQIDLVLYSSQVSSTD